MDLGEAIDMYVDMYHHQGRVLLSVNGFVLFHIYWDDSTQFWDKREERLNVFENLK